MQLCRAHGHSSHGYLERVVVRVEQGRVVGAAPWSEGLGGSEQEFNGLVSENYQGNQPRSGL